MNYPGGKSGDGIYQLLINQIPPHLIYIEGFLGGGAIMRFKRPARVNIGMDLDHDLILKWIHDPDFRYHREDGSFYFYSYDFIEWLSGRKDHSRVLASNPDQIFLYLDPPYLRETRKSSDPIYKYELSRSDHERLLDLIKDRDEQIMISGYNSDLYNEKLSSWRKLEFQAMTRAGSPAQEIIWMNYPEPDRLHDYKFLGSDFTDRQRIKRKIKRWIKKLNALPALERAAIIDAIIEEIDINNYGTR